MPELDARRTARLRLSRPSPADLDDLRRMHRDPRVMATLGGVRTEQEIDAFADRLAAHWEAHGFGWWIARDLASGQFCGRGGLRRVQVGGRDELEIGYGFVAAWWGQGLATELARESAAVAFERLGVADLVAFTLPHNAPSRRVMEKAGLTFERDVDHAGLPHVLYRLTRQAWAANGPPGAGGDAPAGAAVPSVDETLCPLCGASNACAVAEGESIANCWCNGLKLTAEMRDRMPANRRNTSCLCAACGARLAAGAT